MKHDFTIWRNQILENPRDISPLKFDMSQDEVIEIFGKPDAVSTMRSHVKPLILKYCDIELHFDMLVGRELEELCWEPVTMDDPRLTAHPDWLKKFRDFAWSDLDSLTLHKSTRIERTEKGFQICIYNRTDYDALLAGLEKQGLSLPTADEWSYLCGGGCRTLFPWGDGMDYSMHLHHFESPEDEDKPFDMEEPNFFGLSIAYDPYMREVVKAEQFTTCGGDGGRSICGGLGIFLGFLPCSPHCKPEVQEDKELNGDYDFYRPIIRVEAI